jgi:hypothetical protein
MSRGYIEKLEDLRSDMEGSGADYKESTLRDIFKKAGLSSQEVDKAVEGYIKFREAELSPLLDSLAGAEITKIGVEAIVGAISKAKRGSDIIDDILRGYSRYIQQKKEIVEAYQKAKSWEDVITSDGFNSDMGDSMEAFIDYVEEIYKTKVKDAKHLQKLTGLTDESFKKEPGIKAGREATFQSIFIRSAYNRYFRKLQASISEGAKYKDLLQINPQDYGLPKSWSGELGSDQYSSILWAISFEFMLSEGNGFLMYTPSLRAVAKEIDAPYSVLMDCYKLTNR